MLQIFLNLFESIYLYTYCRIFAYNILQNILFLASIGKIFPWGVKYLTTCILNETETPAFCLEILRFWETPCFFGHSRWEPQTVLCCCKWNHGVVK